MRAEIVVEAHLRALRSRRQFQHADDGAARLQLPAEGIDRLQEISSGPHVGVGHHERVAAIPVDPIQLSDRPALVAPVPEAAEPDARQPVLVRLECLLLALGDQQRHPRIGQRRSCASRDVEPGRRSRPLVVANRVAMAVAHGREELAPHELVLAPPEAAGGGAVVREDENVPDLSGQPRAQQPGKVAGRRRVKAGLGDRGVRESRSPQIFERFLVEREPTRGLSGPRRSVTRARACRGRRNITRARACRGRRNITRDRACRGRRNITRGRDCCRRRNIIRGRDCCRRRNIIRGQDCCRRRNINRARDYRGRRKVGCAWHPGWCRNALRARKRWNVACARDDRGRMGRVHPLRHA
jgi:hypothetical protein